MTRPQTIEEAANAQLLIQEKVIAGEMDNHNWRWSNLAPGFEGPVTDLSVGIGQYTRNLETGKVCDWDGVWLCDGKVLLCKRCWTDGT